MKTKHVFRSLCFLAACLMLAGCEKKLGEGVTLKGIAVDEGTVRVNIGETGRAYAYPIPYDCTDYEFKWESADPSIATVDNYGRITSVDVGNTVIKVSQGSISNEIPVEVYEIPLLEQATGYWAFEDAGNFGKATKGADLILVKTGFSSIDGPTTGDKAVRVEKASHFNCAHGISQGDWVTTYTIMMDFKLPAAGRACFMQTNTANSDDVDLFLRPNGYEFGIVGSYTNLNDAGYGPIVADKWYRMVLVVQLGGTTKYFLNGVNVGEKQLPIDNRIRMEKTNVLLFADEDGEDEIIDVAAVAIWDKALSDGQIRRLGVF
ncbi:MAG: Ig-like domain-containing protein [Tannerella sp.]|jgi:hypothetical protein|nr:Ig-like domain-containing protein [Tannerella sp.]